MMWMKTKYQLRAVTLKWPSSQWQQAEQPIQRVGRSRLDLAEKRLPRPEVWVPKREMAGVPLARLDLKPGQNLRGDIGSRCPFKLPSERQLPKESDHHHGQQAGHAKPPHDARGSAKFMRTGNLNMAGVRGRIVASRMGARHRSERPRDRPAKLPESERTCTPGRPPMWGRDFLPPAFWPASPGGLKNAGQKAGGRMPDPLSRNSPASY